MSRQLQAYRKGSAHTERAPCAADMCCEAAPAAAGTTARFNQRADSYRRHAQVQQDMAAWLSQWLPTPDHTGAAGNNASTETNRTGSGAPDANAHTPQSPSSHVLDLGAGEGTFTRYLQSHFAQTTALDAAPRMLEAGRTALPNVHWRQGDAWSLAPLADRAHEFDWVTSASLLQWCHDPQRTLRHWAQLCKPGTRLLHGFYVEPTLHEWRSLFGQGELIHWRSAQEWQHAFADTGWRILRSDSSVRTYHFANALALARSLHGTGVTAHGQTLSPGRYRALLHAYDAQYPANAADNASKHVVATWAFFRIEAVLD